MQRGNKKKKKSSLVKLKAFPTNVGRTNKSTKIGSYWWIGNKSAKFHGNIPNPSENIAKKVLEGYFLPRCMECRRSLAMSFLSVRLSVCQTRALWQNGRKICAAFYTMWKIVQSSFMRRRMVGGGDTFYLKNFGSTGPRWSEIADYEPIIARSASAVRPSEKSSINTNRKSPTRFPTSLRWSPYVAAKSPKGD